MSSGADTHSPIRQHHSFLPDHCCCP